MPTIPADDDSARAIEAVRALARASSLMERASSELSLAHYRVLSAISSGDERASRIAGRLAIGKPTISAAVNAMCERGLLVRMDVEGDLRAVDLRLTLKGRRLLERVEAEMIRRIELEDQLEGAREVFNRAYIAERVSQSLFEEPPKRVSLNRDEVR